MATCKQRIKIRRPVADPLPAETFDLIRLALARALVNDDAGDAAAGPDIPPGKHQIRGVVTVAVDCWVDKGQPIDARMPWPSRDVFALALAMSGKTGDKLRDLLTRAAKRLFARKPDEKFPELDQVLLASDAAQTVLMDEIPRVSKAGAAKVSGRATICNFEPLV